MRWKGMITLTIGAGLLATGCATKTVSTPATPVAPAATGSTGQGGQGNAPATGSGRDTGVVATFHGDGGAPYDSTAFAVHGGHVQLVYTVQPNETGPVPFLWAMYPQGAQPGPTNQRAGDSCPSCDGKQTNDLGSVPAGSYFLRITTSRQWTLTVIEH